MRLGTSLLVGMLSLAACGKDQLQGPKAEVQKSEGKMNLPAVPAFDLPPAGADGSHSVKELRVKGKKLLDSDVTVKGYVTWAYDCATELRTPAMTDADVQKIIDETPDKCQRAKFYIGDAADTPAEKSLWVVDVPRPYNKSEMKNMKPKDRVEPDKCEPNPKDPSKSICPPYKVGDQVEVTGKFGLSSNHGDNNSDGLLMYGKMKNITEPYESPPPAPLPGAPAAAPAPGAKLSPEDLVIHK